MLTIEKENDTTYGSKYADAIGMIEALGFEPAASGNFSGYEAEGTGDEPKKEEWRIYARRDGLLMFIESYNKNINRVQVYGEMVSDRQHPNENACFDIMGSNGPISIEEPETGEWIDKEDDRGNIHRYFDIDLRTGLMRTMERMKEIEMPLVAPWSKLRHIWLIHHGETPGHTYMSYVNYDKYNDDRLKELPEWVQKMINYQGKYGTRSDEGYEI